MIDDNPRKHFEAVIQNLAFLYNEDRIAIRDEIKAILSAKKLIKFSTTELNLEVLKKLANRLHAFYADQEQCPPEFRSELDIEKILTTFCNELSATST